MLGLGNLSMTLLNKGADKPSDVVALTKEQVHSVFNTLVKSMEDYSTDDRGDVGSWVRRAAVSTLEKYSVRVLQCIEKLAYLEIGATGPVVEQFRLSANDNREKYLVKDAEAKVRRLFVSL